jgi:hypothetical protein
MQQVLGSPELLTRICEMIHKDEKLAQARSSLPSAARVNSWWRDIVCGILWGEPPADVLANVRRNRRQKYASYIKTLALSFKQDPTLNTLFGGLEFPRLQGLHLASHPRDTTRSGSLAIHDGWNTTVSQYFGPALETLTLHSCDAVCTPTFLADVAARSSRLKNISWISVGSRLQPDDLSEFFQACNNLEDVYLCLGTVTSSLINSLVTNDVLLCLSRMRKLESFSIGGHTDRSEAFKLIKDQNSAPFPSLKTISLNVSSDPIHR